ncbi:factor of DNA methylation 1 [Lolium perenne]|uniref:factor of DNA methylation 1 n=1 Tax=Lolium perenne TaxID=4522 RepID=UPI0021F5D845|nr:factor of DNA methylation 1-like [Lolium perenne]XP_051224112.1 factor of DNA methylation 1-like [Lolium perenne]
MDLDMDDYMDPYDEAEADAAAEAAGVNGPTIAASDGEESDDSDAESDYEDKSYALLKSGKHRVRNPDGTFRCPFCPGKKKQDYKLKDLLQHADGIGVSSKHRRHGRERAFHRAFGRFVREDPSLAHELATIVGLPDPYPAAPPKPDAAAAAADKGKAVLPNGHITGGSSSAAATQGPPQDGKEKFAWPWCGILAAGAGFNADAFADRVAMFSPENIVPLVFDESQGMECYAIVRFAPGWGGFSDALALDNHFSMNKLGKKEWEASKISSGGALNNGEGNNSSDSEIKVYGWVAREVEYTAGDLVGRYLRKHTNLNTIDEITKRQREPMGKVVAKLASQLQAKNQHVQDLETKTNATEFSIARLEADNRKLHEEYNEAMRNLHRKARDNAVRIFQDNENLKLEIENNKRELISRAKELEKLSAENANDRKRLAELADEKQKTKDDKSELELASIEQQRNDEDILKLVEDQKREKEDALARMLELEKELHEKRELELEVTRLNGTLQVMKHLEGDDDGDIHNKMEKLSERLEHERKRLEEMSGELVKKERESNDELQEARKELITGLDDILSGRTAIGIKRMGELDVRPFENACRRKYGNDDYEMRAAELISAWQDEIKKPAWHPYKFIKADDGTDKEVVNNDDPRLRELWLDYGDDVCNAVKIALSEVNEYNPSGRYVVPELWNFQKNRKATMKEVFRYIFQQMETPGKRRRGR